MPIIGVIIGGLDFSNLSIKVGEARIMYGSFINNVIDFLIVAICIFLFVKVMNKITGKKKEEEKKAPPVKSDEVKLLEEIRDIMKKQK